MANPWKGLASYQESDNAKFHGRKRSVRELVSLIKSKLFITLYGRTGIGKTSLLQAGVFPVLRTARYIPVSVRFDESSEQPYADYIISAIKSSGLVIDELPGAKEEVPEVDRLWQYFATHRFFVEETAGGTTVSSKAFPLIVLDQFEENLRQPRPKARAWKLMQQLYALTDDNKAFPDGYHSETNFRIVVSVREDDLFRLEDCIDSLSLTGLKYNRYRLLQLTDAEAGEIIAIPGDDLLPHDPAERRDFMKRVVELARTDAGDISTLMLSLLLTELYSRSAGKPFTSDMLSDSGMHDLIESFYLKAVAALTDDERSRLEDLMVDDEGRRNSVNEGPVESAYPAWRDLTEGPNRILQVSNGRVEIVHDILAKTIFDIRRTRLEQQRIAQLERQRAAERRKARRRMALLSAGLAVALLIGTIFVRQFLVIRENQQGLLLNQSRAITGMANNLIDNDNDYYRAAQIALEALPRNLSHPDRPYSPEAGFALRRALDHPLPRFLTGHSGVIRSAAFSPDGERIVSCSDDSTIRLWDANTGQPLGEPLRGHTDRVSSVAFSPDGNRIVSGSLDKTIRIWDSRTGLPIGEPLGGHTDRVISVAFSHDGNRIVSGSYDKTIRLWDANTGQTVGEPLGGHTNWVKSVSFSPDGSRIVSGSDDKTIRLWDSNTGLPIGEPLRGHTRAIESVAFSPDGNTIVSGSSNKTIRLWDANTGLPIGEPLRGHRDWIRSVAFSPDGDMIVSGSDDITIRLWDTRTGQPIGEPLRGHTESVHTVAFSPDETRIISGGWDGLLRIWDVDDCISSRRPVLSHIDGYCQAISPDGNKIVSRSWDYNYRIWNARTGQPIGEPLRGHTCWVNSVAFSPDGDMIVSGSDDRTIRLWDANTGQPIGEPLRGHSGVVSSVALSPDGNRIVSGSWDKTIRLWDANTGQPIGEPLRGHTRAIESVAFSPDGNTIISGSWDKTIRIWDSRTGLPIGEPLGGHTDRVISVAFSHDGNRIVSGSWDKTIRLWDANTGQTVGEPLSGHTIIKYVAFSPDGNNIISLSNDETIRIWDVATGGQVYQLEGKKAQFNEEGNKIIYVDLDNNLREYRWRPLQELMDEAREKLTRPLTPEERRKFYLE